MKDSTARPTFQESVQRFAVFSLEKSWSLRGPRDILIHAGMPEQWLEGIIRKPTQRWGKRHVDAQEFGCVTITYVKNSGHVEMDFSSRKVPEWVHRLYAVYKRRNDLADDLNRQSDGVDAAAVAGAMLPLFTTAQARGGTEFMSFMWETLGRPNMNLVHAPEAPTMPRYGEKHAQRIANLPPRLQTMFLGYIEQSFLSGLREMEALQRNKPGEFQ